MNRRVFLGSILFYSLTAAFGCMPKGAGSSPETTAVPSTSHEGPEGYYTCSMHPQIHLREPGKCPICGMPLIKIKGQTQNSDKNSDKNSKDQQRAGLEISEAQKQNAQISKYTVSKNDLSVSIPVAGRSLSSKEIAFQIYESDLNFVKRSSLFSGTLTSQADKILKGHIVAVDRLIDPSSRTVRAVGVLEQNFNMNIESGFQGKITSTLKNSLVIPIDAVLHTGTRDIVYVFSTDGKLRPQEIQVGAKGDLEYQVLSGLKEGDIVSTGANFLLDSEAKLRGF